MTRHHVFTSFWRVGNGGAPPIMMQVESEIGEDNARDPTGEFIARGENILAKFDLVKI